jgi:hypothetical protein
MEVDKEEEQEEQENFFLGRDGSLMKAIEEEQWTCYVCNKRWKGRRLFSRPCIMPKCGIKICHECSISKTTSTGYYAQPLASENVIQSIAGVEEVGKLKLHLVSGHNMLCFFHKNLLYKTYIELEGGVAAPEAFNDFCLVFAPVVFQQENFEAMPYEESRNKMVAIMRISRQTKFVHFIINMIEKMNLELGEKGDLEFKEPKKRKTEEEKEVGKRKWDELE